MRAVRSPSFFFGGGRNGRRASACVCVHRVRFINFSDSAFITFSLVYDASSPCLSTSPSCHENWMK